MPSPTRRGGERELWLLVKGGLRVRVLVMAREQLREGFVVSGSSDSGGTFSRRVLKDVVSDFV